MFTVVLTVLALVGQREEFAPGKVCVVSGDERLGNLVLICNEFLFYREFARVLEAGDKTGIMELHAKDRLSAIDKGTKCLLLEIYDAGKLCEHDVAMVRLKDGPRAGKKAWLPAAWLKLQPPSS